MRDIPQLEPLLLYFSWIPLSLESKSGFAKYFSAPQWAPIVLMEPNCNPQICWRVQMFDLWRIFSPPEGLRGQRRGTCKRHSDA